MLRSIALLLSVCQGGDAPLSPSEELAGFSLPAGYSAELVAADPDIAKVVDIAFDDAGRMWAVTAVEYPVDGNETADAIELYRNGGRDRVLVFDTPTAAGVQKPRTFADGLSIPLTVLPTSNGVLVGQGPDILRLHDKDGDGVADRREVVLTGFGIEDSHLMPHRLTRGPGNWIYVAQGAFNYSRVKTKKGQLVPFDQCKLGRFRPDGSRFEVVGWGLNNIWGFVIDERGQMFIQEANDLGYPVVPFHLGASYPGIGMHRAQPYSPWQPPLADFSMGGTGLSGLAQSEDANGFPAPWDGAFFVANPILSNIQAIRVLPDGPRHRLEKLEDFLSSADPRFRPIAIHYGPDGCLYVVDWYNKIISHNEVPRDHPERDKTRGRIWRIRHESQASRPIPDVSAADTSALIAHLQAPTLWEARAAWHQIVDRKAVELVGELEALVSDSQLETRVRVLAIWCLRDLGRLDTQVANRLVRDSDRNVRRATLGFYEDDSQPAVARLVILQMAMREQDPQARLATIRGIASCRRQPAYLVRFLAGMIEPPLPPGPGESLRSQQSGSDILTGAAGERAFQRSLIRAALEKNRKALLNYIDSNQARNDSVEQRILCQLALGGPEGALGVAALLPQLEREPDGEELTLLGQEAADPEVAAALAEALGDPRTQAAVVDVLVDARERVDRALLAAPLAKAVRDLTQRDPGQENWALFLDAAAAFAITELEPELIAYAREPARTRAEQARALRALIEIGSKNAQLFADLARGCLPGEELQSLAAVALAGCDDDDAFALLLELWPNGSSAVQRAALRELASTPAGAQRLLAALEAGDIAPSAIDSVSFELIESSFGDTPTSESSDRLERVLEPFQTPVLVLTGATEDYLQTGLTLQGPFTVETWVKLDPGVSNADGILGVEGGADFNFAGGRFRVYAGPSQGDKIIAERTTQAETWTHLAVTRDAAGSLLLYINGKLDAARGSFDGPLADLDVGRTSPDAGTAGELTEFRVWKVARSAAEIGDHFRRRITTHPELGFHFPGAEQPLVSGNVRMAKTANAPELLDEAQARAQVAKFTRYRDLAAGPGDTTRGGEVFARDCARCHTVAGEGGQIGPILDGAGSMGTESLLRSLITPNSAVESGYRTLLVRTTDGQLHDGFLASQDDERLILRKPDVEDQILPRSEIESAWFDRLSLMPEDLLEALSAQEVRDLFAYLSSLE